jgi:predicted nucleic acid-binding protein
VRLFLDTSVLLAACGSAKGASAEIFRRASEQHWVLVTTAYVLEEMLTNIVDFSPAVSGEWAKIRPMLLVMDDVLTLDRPSVFPVLKDKPVLFSAAAWADVLVTLDQADFQNRLGGSFYELAVLRPGQFLERERSAGRLLH